MTNEHWSAADIDGLLALLPTLTAPDFKIATWGGGDRYEKDGKTFINMPWIEYHEVVRQMSGFIHISPGPLRALPEDAKDMQPADWTPELFEGATLNQIQRYFQQLYRGERFSEGAIEGQFEKGNLVAALERLKALRKRMS